MPKTINFLTAILIVVLPLYSISLQGSHIAGANVTYNWLSGNQYEVKVTIYRDCDGINAPDSVLICLSSPSTNFSDSIRLPQFGSPVVLPPFPYLPPITSTCLGGTGYGLEKYTYKRIISIPFSSNDWVIYFTGNPISPPGTTIPPPSDLNFIVSTQLNTINYPNNSSVEFTTDPTFQFCVLQPAWDLFYSTDSDGDSLVYSITPTYIDSNICPAQPILPPLWASGFYAPPFSSTPYFIHPSDGWVHFNPIQIEVAFMTVTVEEYRNNIIINQTHLTHMMNIVSGCTISGTEDGSEIFRKFEVYPTITTNFINVHSVQNITDYQIWIYDVTGRIVLKDKLLYANDSKTIDLSNYKKGMYYIMVSEVENPSKIETFKVIKQ